MSFGCVGRLDWPGPKARCMRTELTQRPNLNPTALKTPTGWKPRLLCSAIDPAFPLSPMTAIIWRHGPASQRAINAASKADPTPRPRDPSAT